MQAVFRRSSVVARWNVREVSSDHDARAARHRIMCSALVEPERDETNPTTSAAAEATRALDFLVTDDPLSLTHSTRERCNEILRCHWTAIEEAGLREARARTKRERRDSAPCPAATEDGADPTEIPSVHQSVAPVTPYAPVASSAREAPQPQPQSGCVVGRLQAEMPTEGEGFQLVETRRQRRNRARNAADSELRRIRKMFLVGQRKRLTARLVRHHTSRAHCWWAEIEGMSHWIARRCILRLRKGKSQEQVPVVVHDVCGHGEMSDWHLVLKRATVNESPTGCAEGVRRVEDDVDRPGKAESGGAAATGLGNQEGENDPPHDEAVRSASTESETEQARQSAESSSARSIAWNPDAAEWNPAQGPIGFFHPHAAPFHVLQNDGAPPGFANVGGMFPATTGQFWPNIERG